MIVKGPESHKSSKIPRTKRLKQTSLPNQNNPKTSPPTTSICHFNRNGFGKITNSTYSLIYHFFQKRKNKPLPNFHIVDQNKLFRGAAPRDQGIKTLKEIYDVTTIIDLRDSKKYAAQIAAEKKAAKTLGIEHLNISMLAKVPPTPEQIQKFFKIIAKSPGKIYMHCREGKDRAGIMSALYRIEKQGWTNEKAYEEMIKYGHDLLHKIRYDKQGKFLSQYQKGSYRKDIDRLGLDVLI